MEEKPNSKIGEVPESYFILPCNKQFSKCRNAEEFFIHHPYARIVIHQSIHIEIFHRDPKKKGTRTFYAASGTSFKQKHEKKSCSMPGQTETSINMMHSGATVLPQISRFSPREKAAHTTIEISSLKLLLSDHIKDVELTTKRRM